MKKNIVFGGKNLVLVEELVSSNKANGKTIRTTNPLANSTSKSSQ